MIQSDMHWDVSYYASTGYRPLEALSSQPVRHGYVFLCASVHASACEPD